MNNILKLSWSLFYRDVRAGELNLLSLALLLAVASVTTVSFFIDRLDQAIRLQSGQLIAADVVVTSTRPIRQQVKALATEPGLTTSTTQSFRTVIVAGNQTQLVEVKAVANAYPLRGELQITDKLFGESRSAQEIPQAGEAWVEPRLLQLTGLKVGDTIAVGAKQLTIKYVITSEPDRGGDLFSLAPRVMMSLQDVAATKLIVPGSRVNYRLLVAGKPERVRQFISEFESVKNQHESLIQINKGSPELRFAFERADYFLNLVALIAVALSALSIAMTASRYSQRHLDMFALFRCMGFTQSKIILVIFIELVWLLLIVTLLGTLIGYLLQFGLTAILGKMLIADLPAPTLKPLLTGGLVASLSLLGFVLPPLWLLKKTPPMRVLRRHLGVESNKTLLMFVTLATLAILYLWQLGQSKTTWYMMSGLAATVAALYIFALAMIKLIRVTGITHLPAVRFGIANITQRARASATQIMAFGIGIFVLLFLVIVQNELLNGWRQSIPKNVPNYFLVNIQKEQISDLTNFYRENELRELKIYPMVRARLIAINNKPVNADQYESERAKRLVHREFNLSWLEKQQSGNTIIAGEWWDRTQFSKPLISLDVGIAKSLKINLGDSLQYDIAGERFDLKVSSIRAVEWNSFQANFFAVVPPDLLQDYPANWITSTYIPADKKDVIVKLVRKFPNVSVIDIDEVIKRIRNIVNKVSLAVEYMLGFTLLAGILIMWAAIQATFDERKKHTALLRTLGATTAQLRTNLAAEFVLLGGLAGFIGGICSSILAWTLADRLFKFEYSMAPMAGVYGLIAGIVIVSLVGYIGTRRVLLQSPATTFRQS